MILDQLSNAATYFGMHPRLAQGLRFLADNDLRALAVGRHAIDGNNLFALVQDYQTQPREGARWETHRRYFDIQFIVSGEELMGYAPLAGLTTVQEYDAEKDCALHTGEPGHFFRLAAGEFVIFAPQDAHMPGRAIAEPAPTRKVVIKALI
ncbi:MAG: YhcH/YjgK/YiaL family protein [Kiritimatiellia bacterium]|nr:YhcH/YjgK/YiaL family protein [Lentisphaerota bacterium]